ncbi:hypothetical protein P3X46_003546 [Hevea brasiliensis]|uniref:Uncharacterized protein n=2 Tax=Hevea brasiliensis TaxID=3981 RepID=A0A6A6NIA6_HEVBR|nr:uncharacterized protein LOC110653620 [Hevea brasiliensis]KAF2324895.1 hypothetical protein GH714_021091 [Hevea brasiliensis]KAJ9188157.1 hypothetical protein P3X46_003546 [Hevea brasiliensis]
MRIRKNGKFSPLTFSHGVQQPYMCLLNQSPWDAIPFSQENFQSAIHQFERDNSFDGNGSFLDSVQAVKRENEAAVKMKVDNSETEKNQGKEKVLEDREEMEVKKEFKLKLNEGENTFCNKNKPKQAHSMYNHHLTSVKSSTSKVKFSDSGCPDLNNTPLKKSKTVLDLGRSRAAKRGRSSSSYRHEFYYYSGFGPLWGKKKDRGEGNKSKGKASEIS